MWISLLTAILTLPIPAFPVDGHHRHPKKMKFVQTVVATLWAAVVVATATPTPPTNTCGVTSVSNHNNFFGVSSSLTRGPAPSAPADNSAILVRGGEVLHPSSREEVEAIILNAAGNGKLVVIDFTASWYVPQVVRFGLLHDGASPYFTNFLSMVSLSGCPCRLVHTGADHAR